MRVTSRLLATIASADPAPVSGGVAGIADVPLYLVGSDRDPGTWALGVRPGWVVSAATLTELRESSAQPDGSYLTRNVERRWLVGDIATGYAISADLPSEPPPPPPEVPT